MKSFQGCLAGSVKCLTLDFGSGHDFMANDLKPHFWLCAESAEPAWDPLSIHLSLFPSPASSFSLSLFQK